MIGIIIIKNLNFLIERVFFMTLKFAYWAPNVSGGLVISKLPQKTGWDFEDNVRYPHLEEAYTTAELLFSKLPIAKKDDTLGRTFLSPFGGLTSAVAK